jgi:hypothetical protein
VPDRHGLRGWNSGPHRRNFLTAPGRYLEAGAMRSDELVFWGEVGAAVPRVRTYHDPMPGEPRFLFEPYYTPPAS